MWMLKSGTHYNRYLQAVYCKYESTLEYGILEEIECSLEELSGIKFTEEQLEKKRQRVIGEKNPQSKITDAQFFEIVELLKCGKTNPEIADMYNLHPNYVSLIRHKKRYKYLWGKVQNYMPVKSEHQLKTRGRVTLEMFLDIVQMLQAGESNASIERKHGLSSGTGSRIRHRKLYKQWWVRYVDKGTFNDYPNGGEIPQEE